MSGAPSGRARIRPETPENKAARRLAVPTLLSTESVSNSV
jgi:hypothetical protein